MLEFIPKNIKDLFIITFCVFILAFFLGFIFNNKYIYISYSLGILISLLTNLYLLYTVYKIVYLSNNKIIMLSRYLISIAMYVISIYLTYYLINDNISVIINSLGLLSFRIIMHIYQLLKR